MTFERQLAEETPMTEEIQPRLLQTLGHKVFSLARYAADKVSQLPKPLGPTIGMAEGIMQPLAQFAENQSLHLLEFLDDKIYGVGEVVEKYVGHAISAPKQMAIEVRRRGLVGSVADVWVEYEHPVKEKSESIIRVMNKVPGFTLVSPVLTGVGAFAFNTVSDWLVEHSESKEKLPHDENAPKQMILSEESGQESDIDTKDHEFVKAKLESEETDADAEDIVASENKQDLSSGTVASTPGGKQDEEEADELTKLIDASWGLGSL